MEPPEIQPASINISVQQTEANRFSVDNLVAFACGGHQAVVIQDGPAPARTGDDSRLLQHSGILAKSCTPSGIEGN
jgi:hypothetical protein